MKSLILTFLICFVGISFSQSDTTVYICNSKNSKAYHLSKECFALKNCKSEIKSVSKYDAVNTYGRTLCGHED
jgi:hypothetical protein